MSLLDNDLDDGDELDSTPRSNPTPKLKVQMMVSLLLLHYEEGQHVTTLSARCEKTFRPSADQLDTIEKTPSADQLETIAGLLHSVIQRINRMEKMIEERHLESVSSTSSNEPSKKKKRSAGSGHYASIIYSYRLLFFFSG